MSNEYKKPNKRSLKRPMYEAAKELGIMPNNLNEIPTENSTIWDAMIRSNNIGVSAQKKQQKE